MDAKKTIRLSEHAKEQIRYRGCNEKEISETIQTSQWERAELGRFQCKKDFSYNSIWNGKQYKTKQIKPIFVEEKNETIVVTAYVYYF